MKSRTGLGAAAGLVGIEGGVVSGVTNLESSGVGAPEWRPRHDEPYHEERLDRSDRDRGAQPSAIVSSKR